MQNITYIERDGRHILVRVIGNVQECRHLPDFANEKKAIAEFHKMCATIELKRPVIIEEATIAVRINDFNYIKIYDMQERRKKRLKARRAGV
jgi:hypothetical protein